MDLSRTTVECAAYLVDIDHPDSGSISSCTKAVPADGGAVPVPADGGPVAVASASSGPANGSASAAAPPSPSTSGGSTTDPSSGTGGGIAVPPDAVPPDVAPRPTAAAPSASAALDVAGQVLAALGIEGTPRALDAWSDSRTVLVDPVVGGMPTVGVATTVDVDTSGVVAATGRLEAPAAGPDYPILTARGALDRLGSLPQPMPAVDCPVSKDGTTSCSAGALEPTVVTGATLGLMLSYDSVDPVLVPAWLFTVDGWTDPMPVIAVTDQYLGGATPSPGSGSGSSPGSGGPDATLSPIPPATGDLPATRTSDPGTVVGPTPIQPGGVAVTSASLGKDGRTLTLTGWGGVCAEYRGDAKETDTEVYVVINSTPTVDKDMACIELAKEISVDVVLQAPLGSRTVQDGNTGETLKVG